MSSKRFGLSKLSYRDSRKIVEEVPTDEEVSTNGEMSTDEEVSTDEDVKPTQEEHFRHLTEAPDPGSDGEDCELHVYESRRDTRGEEVILRAGTKSNIESPKRKSHRACLVLTRYYASHSSSNFRKPLRTKLEIQSRHIIAAMRAVIGTYGGVDLQTDVISMYEPPRCLFHFRHELRRYAQESQNQQLMAHVQLCLQYVEKTLHQEIKTSQSMELSPSATKELEYDLLWIVFRPGCLVYEKRDGFEQLYRFISIEEDMFYDNYHHKMMARGWSLRTECIRNIAGRIGLVYHSILIRKYEGYTPIHMLSACPMEYRLDKERIREELLLRGRKFISLYGIHHRFYDGPAKMCTRMRPKDFDTQKQNITHRIIIDHKQYSVSVSSSAQPGFVPGTSIYNSAEDASQRLSENDVLTCPPYVHGFSLETKRWGAFSVPNVHDIAYNDMAFDGLMLSAQKKQLLACLIKSESNHVGDEYDDLIQGKGKGIIILLHGPPGVGKTFTAESIADHTQRSLLKITSNDLPMAGPWQEEKISNLFSLATRWNSVVLMDEADVFMQQRTLDNPMRNGLVSTLLRLIEYFEGTILLTTNRPETIDYAFKSRIHLSIPYPPLTPSSRRQLWARAIITAAHGKKPDWLTEEVLEQLGEKAVNGREIKNAVRLGYSFAQGAKRDMQASDVVISLEALEVDEKLV